MQLVTGSCTTWFSIQKFYVLSTEYLWILEQTVIITLHSNDWLVFITKIECAYSAAWTETLNIVQFNIKYFIWFIWEKSSLIKIQIMSTKSIPVIVVREQISKTIWCFSDRAS